MDKSVLRQQTGTVMSSTPIEVKAIGSEPREYAVVTPKADRYRKRRSSLVESIRGTSKVEGKGDDSMGDEDYDRKPPLRQCHPPTFDGKNVIWHEYRKQFEAASRLNGWSMRQKADYLVVSLRGPATRILSDLTDKQLSLRDYESLVGVLEKRFDPPGAQLMDLMIFRGRIRLPGESVAEFKEELERLCRKLHRKFGEKDRSELVKYKLEQEMSASGTVPTWP